MSMTNRMYAEEKRLMSFEDGYYGSIRREILPLIPDNISKALDIGCGAGNTLVWLRSLKHCAWTGGVELLPQGAAQARQKLDAVYEGNIEHMDLPIEKGSIDLILCLDVLEHLVDPWKVIQRLQSLLKRGGMLVVSIPNIRNRHVLLPLLLQGKWEYVESGILDRTHLRFFTRQSAVELVSSAGLKIDRIEITGGISRGWKAKILKKILPEWIESFFVRHYLIRGIRE